VNIRVHCAELIEHCYRILLRLISNFLSYLNDCVVSRLISREFRGRTFLLVFFSLSPNSGPLRYDNNRNVLNKGDGEIRLYECVRWWLSMGRPPEIEIMVPIWKCVGPTPIWSRCSLSFWHTYVIKRSWFW